MRFTENAELESPIQIGFTGTMDHDYSVIFYLDRIVLYDRTEQKTVYTIRP